MLLRPITRPLWRPKGFAISAPSRKASTSPIKSHPARPSLTTIPTCPHPRCACAETPVMPEGSPILRSGKMAIAAYAEQVLVCTGKDDWLSRVEEENSGDNLAADVKELMGRGGIYSDPYHNVLITNSSFPSSIPDRAEIQSTSVYLLPSFKYVPYLPRVSFESVEALVQGYLLPIELHPANNDLSPVHKDRLTRQTEKQNQLCGVQDVRDILVLICGHGGRDIRCGIYGPLLRSEFEARLPQDGFEVLTGPIEVPKTSTSAGTIEGTTWGESKRGARVGLISHIGGHKFAGNVIIYIPPGAKTADGGENELAGCGIWYGRVEPKHVEGIVKETVLGGRIIEDLFRGGIGKDGGALRIR